MSKGGELLKSLLMRDFTWNTMELCSDYLRTMADKQKEESAGKMLAVLKDSVNEQDFLDLLKSANIIE